jgi:hypothetical protein
VINHASVAVVLRHYLDLLLPQTHAARVLFDRLIPVSRASPVPGSPVALSDVNALASPEPTLQPRYVELSMITL